MKRITKKYLKKKWPKEHRMHELIDYIPAQNAPNIFEKELGENETSLDVGFVLQATSLVFRNRELLFLDEWEGAGSTMLKLKVQVSKYDKLTVRK